MNLPKPVKAVRVRRPIARASRPARVRRTPFAKCYRLAMSAWEALIRSTSEQCVSGRSRHEGPIQAAHGFSRRYRHTSLDPRNGLALCRSCHCYYTHRETEWTEWLRRCWGEGLYEELRAKRDNTEPLRLDDLREAVELMQVALFERREITAGTDAAQAAIAKAVAVLWRNERAGREQSVSIQWLGNNWADIVTFAGVSVHWIAGDPEPLLSLGANEEVHIPRGAWLVRDAAGVRLRNEGTGRGEP